MNMEDQKQRIVELQNYDFEVRHKPGKDNTNADDLSRCEHMPPPIKEEAKEAEEEATGKLCKICCINELTEYIRQLDEEEQICELYEIENQEIR